MEEKQNDEGQEYCGLADIAFEAIYEDKLTAKNCCKYTIPTHTTLSTILYPFNPVKTAAAVGMLSKSTIDSINITPTQVAFLQAHKNMSHISYERIRKLARQGDCPKSFINCTARHALHTYMPKPPNVAGEINQGRMTIWSPKKN